MQISGNMKQITHEIQTEPILTVKNDCPLGVFRTDSYINRDRKFEACKNCEFFLEFDKCGHQVYETPLIKHDSYTEPDDCSFALPSTDYTWNFKCSNCGETFTFTSGFSVMQHGDTQKCRHCKTLHKYLEHTKNMHTFAIPIGGEQH